jgi:hypothetical protein
MRIMTCALAAPTHNVSPHMVTNRHFLKDIRTSGIAYVRQQLIRNCCCGAMAWLLPPVRRTAAKAYHQTDGRNQRKAAWWHILR